jgi:hypothetical protein
MPRFQCQSSGAETWPQARARDYALRLGPGQAGSMDHLTLRSVTHSQRTRMSGKPGVKAVKPHSLATISLDLTDRVPHNPPVNLALKGGGAL